jgi:hypothetical protein
MTLGLGGGSEDVKDTQPSPGELVRWNTKGGGSLEEAAPKDFPARILTAKPTTPDDPAVARAA